MNQLITPELSDRILGFLTERVALGDYEEFRSHDFPEADKISVDAIDVLLDDLREKGLIEILSRGHSGYDYAYEISINKAAIDFRDRGGFLGQEVRLKQSLEKLIGELRSIPALAEDKSRTIRTLINEINQYLVSLR